MADAERDRRLTSAVTVADPSAVALATYADAFGVKVDPDWLGVWLPLIGVLALEVGAACSVVLVRATSCDPAKSENIGGPALPETSTTTGDAVAQNSGPCGRNRKVGPPKRATKPKRRDRCPPDDEQCGPPKRGLAGWIESHAPGEVISLSQRKLARSMGISRATLQRHMRQLATKGVVSLKTSASGTTVSLASQRV